MIKPIDDNVLIRRIKEKEAKYGLVLPDVRDSDVDPIAKGKVLAVGKGKKALKTGALILMTVRVGDIVLYKNYSFDKMSKGGEKEVILTHENNILAVIK